MARIRSLKPEFWDDRKLARATSRDARMLYMGLWNQADEHARVNGDVVWLKGRIFPYDDDITTAGISALLGELERAGRIQRYEHDGDPFIHVPKLPKHQRLEPAKVESKLPEPPPRASQSAPFPNPGADTSEPRADESAPDAGSSVLLYGSGSMEHGSGVGDAREPRADTAQTIVAEWIERCTARPPGKVIGQVAKLLGEMLAEGIDPDDIRRGMSAWMAKGLHPSTLPSVVNEVMNAPRAGPGSASSKAAGWLTIDQQQPLRALGGTA